MCLLHIYICQIIAAASITNNIENNLVCPGEELIFNCTSRGTTQRWNIVKGGIHLLEQVFTSGQQVGTQGTWDVYEFILISTQYNNFESTLSTVVTNAMNNTDIVCRGLSRESPATVTLRIEGKLACEKNMKKY